MEIPTKRSRTNNKTVNNVLDSDAYQHKLQFYKVPPTGTVALYEFEEFAVERLKVLKAVESASEKFKKDSSNYEEYLVKELKKTMLKGHVSSQIKDWKAEQELELRRKDHISHFILRLAYCKSDELQRWFIRQEVDLFRFRFQFDKDNDEKKRFLELNNLHYELISAEEKQDLLKELAAASNVGAGSVETKEYFKVHFTEALDLVQKRKVYLRGGYAYVPYDDMITILMAVYRSQLSHDLAVTARAIPHLEENERLLPMLSGLSKRYLSADYSMKKNVAGLITADMVEMLSKKSFPPCMQQLHTGMRQNHHLRYGGRLQYGLFLKGIGLSLDEAMKFWRSEFTKIIDGDKFDKQYSYNIRHSFGKEGKRADYTPYSCLKVIMSNPPGPGDCHGCPFRHTDADLLKQKLKSQTIGESFLERIMSEVKAGKYNVACTRYFEATHKLPMDSQQQVVNHPNQYFDESQKQLGGDSKSQSLGTPKTPRTDRVPGSQSTPKSQGTSQQTQSTPKSQGTSQSQTQSSTPSQGTSQADLSGFEAMDDDSELLEAEMLLQTQ